MSFSLSKTLHPSKVFITRKTDVTGRWDPFYFRPELVALEDRVKKVTPHHLREFVVSMAGGATPSTTESNKHYTESNEGVPFIRVQNLSTSGRLTLEDCKRITRSTHEGLLKRSRLTGGELLVKITGVGRMAVASVVPEGFEGNINQHIVAIRTKDIKTSEAVAAYLNLDISERLASRRSTGGTRPALDYPALLSLPIVFDEKIPKLMQAAVKHHREQMRKAEALLATIENVLLDELGVPHEPEPPNSLESRIFDARSAKLRGGRWDSHFHHPRYESLDLQLGSIRTDAIRLLASNVFSGITPLSGGDAYTDSDDGIAFVRSGDFTPDGTVDEGSLIRLKPDIHNGVMRRSKLKKYDVLFAIVGATIGKVGIFLGEYEANINQAVCAVRFNNPSIAKFVHVFFLCSLGQRQISRLKRPVARANVNLEELSTLRIPVLEKKHRERIVSRAVEIQEGAKALRAQARADLAKAKRDIEALILGKEEQVK